MFGRLPVIGNMAIGVFNQGREFCALQGVETRWRVPLTAHQPDEVPWERRGHVSAGPRVR